MPVPDSVTRAVQKVSTQPWFAKVAPRVVPPLDRAVSAVTRGKYTMSGIATPVVVLTCIGAKSGAEREVPLRYMPDDDAWVVVASNFGREKHPAWMYNLQANPQAWVTEGGERIPVTARNLTGDEREQMWQRLVDGWQAFEAYDARTPNREIQIFRLERRAA